MLVLSLADAFTSPGRGPNPSQSQKDTWLYLQVVCSKFLDLRSLQARDHEHSGAYPAVSTDPSGS